MLWIYGHFSQVTQKMELDYRLRGELVRTSYSKVLENFEGTVDIAQGTGEMTDTHGSSKLSDVKFVHQETLSYTKQYDGRSDAIRYNFQFDKVRGFFTGTYDGEATGPGRAHCIALEIHESFQDVPFVDEDVLSE